MGFFNKLSHAWNALANPPENLPVPDHGPTYSHRPDRVSHRRVSTRSMVLPIYNRMAVDAADVTILHARLDQEDRFLEPIASSLNNCLTVEANLDQAARHFRQDIYMTMFEEGVVAIVPIDTSVNVNTSGTFDIFTMRVAPIVEWAPRHVKVRLYNVDRGVRQDVWMPKKAVAIVENPFYSIMNEPNSTLQRLINKLNLLDTVDARATSGKLDLIIQLPYVIKSQARQDQANKRRQDLEAQLEGSRYGIGYTDATEKITQLNRPVENDLLKQVDDLYAQLHTQLGLTPEIMNGTADQQAMVSYFERTTKPLVQAVVEAMIRSFLTQTARTQKQSIVFFRDVFKFATLAEAADALDKLSRNEITSSNEGRVALGLRPRKDPKADELRNSNMPETPAPINPSAPPASESNLKEEGDSQNGS